MNEEDADIILLRFRTEKQLVAFDSSTEISKHFLENYQAHRKNSKRGKFVLCSIQQGAIQYYVGHLKKISVKYFVGWLKIEQLK